MKKKALAVASVTSIGLGTAMLFAGTTSATATPSPKVTICHATASATNPYTSNDVDMSSVDEEKNQYLNGHGDHEGDIIPPFTNTTVENGSTFPGKNWTEAGQAIYNNGCKVVVVVVTQSPTPTPTPTVTETTSSPTPTPTETSTPTPTPTVTETTEPPVVTATPEVTPPQMPSTGPKPVTPDTLAGTGAEGWLAGAALAFLLGGAGLIATGRLQED